MRKFLLFSFAVFSFSTLSAQYTAHEWGTFTTLAGSDGKLLPGLHVDEEQLPDFTYSHADIYRGEGTGNDKGFSVDYELTNVTVKMETPVIYFYSQKQMDVNVRVDFPRGAVSQWYPHRSSGEQLPNDLKLNFSSPYKGWIQWNTKILPGKDAPAYSAPQEQVSSIWQAPRETDANRIEVNGQVEKYLFYRGVANFTMPVKTRFEAGKLVLENMGNLDIPYVFIIEKRKGQREPTIWWTGNLPAGKTYPINPLEPGLSSLTFQGGLNNFRNALVEAGLYEKEAASMLKTWETSYFGTDGIKVFWVLPEAITNEILPITLTPALTSLKRVIVARSEILSPQFEEELKLAFAKDEGAEYGSDRYYLAYKARVEAMNAQSAGLSREIDRDYESLFKVYPNPGTREIQVHWLGENCLEWNLTIVDAAGRELVRSDRQKFCRGDYRILNIDQISAGSYFLRIRGADTELTLPLMKQ